MAAKPNDAAQALLQALRHPLRRSLLRLCVEAAEMRSPKELTGLTKQPLSNVSYHVRVLAQLGALEIVHEEAVRGSIAHFYRPTALVEETPWVRAAIGLPVDG